MGKTQIQVLLVEDSPTDVTFLREALENDALTSFDLTIVERLSDALSLSHQGQFDVILLDLGLPDSQGLDTFVQIHRLAPDLPVVVCSGNKDEQAAIQAVRAGAQDYLVKGPETWGMAARTLRYAIERHKLGKSLQESVERNRQISALISDYAYAGLLLPDGASKTEWISGAFERITGYTTAEINNFPAGFSSMVFTEDLEWLADQQPAFLEKQSQTVEYRIRRKDGQTRWLRDYMQLVPGLQLGGGIRIIGAVQDITESKQAQESLMRNERVLRLFVEHSPAAIAMFDQEMKYIVASRRYLQDYGLGEQDLTGRSHYDVFPEITERLKEIHKRCLAGAIERAEAEPFPRADGHTDWVRWEIHPWYEAVGQVGGLILFSEVVTKRVQDAAILRESEERFRTVANFNYDWEYWVGTDHRIVYTSPSCERITGYSTEAFQTTPQLLEEIVYPEDLPVLQKHHEVAFTQKEAAVIDFRIVTASGEVRWINHVCQAVYGADGRWLGRRASNRDITARKQAEQKNRELEEFIRATIDALSAQICVLDENGVIVLTNRAWDEFAEGNPPTPKEHYLGTNYLTICDLARGPNAVEADAVAQGIRAIMNGDLERFQLEYPCHSPWVERWFVVKVTRFAGYDPNRIVIAHENITERMQAEASLRKSEEQYRYLFENNPHPMWAYDVETLAFLAVNDAAVDKYGYAREEFLEMTIEDIRPTIDVQYLLEDVAQMHPVPGHLNGFRHRLKDGTVIEVEISSHTLNLAGRKAALVVALDVTERKRAEDKLRESEKKYRSLHDSMIDGFVSVTLDGRILECNATYREMLGYSESELAGLTYFDLTPEAWHAYEAQIVESQILKRGYSDIYEKEYHRKDGSVFPVELHTVLIRGEDGQPIHMWAIVRDISRRKKAEEEKQALIQALSARTADLSLLLEAGHALSETLNRQQIYVIVNRYVKTALPCDMLVISSFDPQTEMISCDYLETEAGSQDVSGFLPIPLELPGQGTQSRVIRSGEALLLPDYVAALKNTWTTCFFDENTRSAIIVPLTVDRKVVGAIQVFSTRLNAHTEDHLRFLEVLALHISASLSNARLFGELEQRVQQRTAEIEIIRQRLELATKAAELGVWDWNIKTGELLWDEQMSLNYGIDQGAFRGTIESFMSLVHPEDISILMDFTQRVIEAPAKSQVNFRIIHGDGSIGYATAHGIILRDAAGLPMNVIGVIQDVTREKLAELSLRESEEQNRLLFEESPEAIAMLDQTGKFERVNHGYTELSKFAVEELIGRSAEELGLVSKALFTRLGEALTQALERHETFATVEHALVCKDGTILSNVESRLFLLKLGEVMHILVSSRDISAHKKAKEALLLANAEMERALRLKDEFLANMSHELRTPLNAILGISESLEEQVIGPLNDKQQHYIRTVSESGRHLLALINDILDISKIGAGRMELSLHEVPVETLVQSSLRLVKEQMQKKKLNFSSNLDCQIQTVLADERRLKQVLVNLLSNAVKFTPENGQIGLDISGDRENSQVTFTVWDTGIGIDLEDLPRLFQPFVQLDAGLDREYAGTGLGLALVAEIVRLHGGRVGVQSQRGEGSRFFVILPWDQKMDSAARPASADVPTQSLAPILRAKRRRILLVEDTESVILFIGDYLQALGYQVTVARNGLAGVAEATKQPPDLILMDIQMPGMDGFEATRVIRSNPALQDIPIIAMTAMAMPGDRERCLEAGMQDYLSKPISLKALAQIAHDYLRKSRRKSL